VKVILVGRTKAKLEETPQEINRNSGILMADIFSADLTDGEDVRKLAEYVEPQYGDLHVPVNNAGGSTCTRILQICNLKSVFLIPNSQYNHPP
jgi:meso-butanediol dehydrogenase/(S,S)-butanediol dehydrogenase/diacetyl reductase